MREKQLLDVGELVLPDQLGQRPQEEAAQRDDDDADGDEVEPVDPVRVDCGVEVRGVVAIGAVLHVVASGRKGRELRNQYNSSLFPFSFSLMLSWPRSRGFRASHFPRSSVG